MAVIEPLPGHGGVDRFPSRPLWVADRVWRFTNNDPRPAGADQWRVTTHLEVVVVEQSDSDDDAPAMRSTC
jgi:hypothetical protein